MKPQKLGELLLERKLINQKQLNQALEIQKHRHQPLGQIIVSLGFISRDLLKSVLRGDAPTLPAQTIPSDLQSLEVLQEGALDRLVSEAMVHMTPDSEEEEESEAALTEADIRPVVGLVNQILTSAVRLRASDIHIEPRKEYVEIRYRLDGKLQQAQLMPKKLQAALIARLKIMAQLDIVEYRVPQDGRITFTVDHRPVDLRVSVLPTYHGQRVVLRILDKDVAMLQLSELGFAESNLRRFEAMIRKPYGLVLVTGPTGSGKTTTLYAAIRQLKETANNIMTCEDPVEYDIEGINQSHVNERVGLTFAAQLRAILRQDPDIILVGEIRDSETAETAIRAALTGHLVLSTLHCNDAPSAVARLVDIGIEPFLISATLIGVTAQRLVRLLCPHCKKRYAASAQERLEMELLFQTIPETLYAPVGCPHCYQTGFRGRIGLHEVFSVTPAVQQAISSGGTTEQIRSFAAQDGFRSMQADAGDRVLAGLTTLSEIRRQVFYETLPVVPSQTVMRSA